MTGFFHAATDFLDRLRLRKQVNQNLALEPDHGSGPAKEHGQGVKAGCRVQRLPGPAFSCQARAYTSILDEHGRWKEMKKTRESLFGLLAAAVLLALVSGNAFAGGLVDISLERFMAIDDAGGFANSEIIDNPWWTLPAGFNFLYFTESDDECEWNLVEVLDETTDEFSEEYAGTNARIILDRAWVEDDCDYEEKPNRGDFNDFVDDNPTADETTYDWFAQDTDKNIWYMGENTFNGVDHHGSFTAGCDQNADEEFLPPAEAGIVVLGEPAKGEFYKQEFLATEAQDWGKVLNFIELDGMECMKAKEWSPLEPGHIEHKFYCHDDPEGPGALLLIHELQGKTVVVDLIEAWAGPSEAPAPTAPVNMTPQCPPYTAP